MPLFRLHDARVLATARGAIWRLLTAALLLAALALPDAAPALAAAPAQVPLAAPQSLCTLQVSTISDTGAGSLRDTVACAVAGQTVTFAGGLAGQTISLTSGEISLPNALTIDGSGAPGVMIDAGHLSRIFSASFSFPETITLTALTLQRGATSANGGAVAAPQGTVVLNQVNVLSSTAAGAGGAVWALGTLIMQGGLIRGNVSGQTGGGVRADDLVLSGTQVISNSTQIAGGGVELQRGTLTNGYFERNSCGAPNCVGGGLERAPDYTTVALTNTVFLSNTADNRGGGVDAASALTLVNGRFEGNGCSAANQCQGAGLYSEAPLSLNGTQFLGNASFLSGGGLYAAAALTLTNGLFQANTCTYGACEGGGLYAADTLTLTGTQFLSNTSRVAGGGADVVGAATLTGGMFQGNTCTVASCRGGGLYAADTLTLTGTQFLSNTSRLAGGAVYAVGAATVVGASFQGNGCLAGGCLGGGFYPQAGGVIGGSTFAGNTADLGAGLIITGAAKVTLYNSTLAANVANVAGGGLFVGGTGTAQLLNLTVANNQAPLGGGLRSLPAATVGITNTIFSVNGDLDCLGPIDAGSHNLEWSDATCGAAGPAAGFTLANPLLGPLALNAPGSTLTFALLTHSPAIDAGDAATCAASPVNNLDQRGVARPLDGDGVGGAVCDIGAFEAPAFPVHRLYLPITLRAP
jgi:predicted outer membrane repeat protein